MCACVYVCVCVYSLTVSFPTNVSVWKRLKEAEDGPPFLCPKCGRTYSHKCNLTRHLRLECGVGPRFQCANCKKRFKHRHHLRDHQRIHLYANCYESRNWNVTLVPIKIARVSIPLFDFLFTRSIVCIIYSLIIYSSESQLMIMWSVIL